MKRIVVLGSTGSIGRNVLDVVERHPDRFEVVGLSAHRNGALLAGQCRRHPGSRLAATDAAGHALALAASPDLEGRSAGVGNAALVRLIREAAPDLVVNAVVGFAGLAPTMEALGAGIPVAIANKETVVTGGRILLEAARRTKAALIPIDSEHVAISQCLAGARRESVSRVIMTASGGALRDRTPEEAAHATVEEVLAHPNWDMGEKITVDSATLVNKGLEVIEAHWLFEMPYTKIEVVVHPQSIVHSLVEFVDGSIIAQMGRPDMRLPILYALSYPDRVESGLRDEVSEFPSLTFAAVDPRKYPCFDLVLAAARAGGNAPTVLNAANEVAVGAFLARDLPFSRIHEVIDGALAAVPRGEVDSLDDIVETDAATRRWIRGALSIGAA
jgi:1-deoxy-D-xylulose-5-phosphate reductoisomerase